VLPSCPFSRAFPYPQPGDAGGRRSALAICQSLTSADPTALVVVLCNFGISIGSFVLVDFVGFDNFLSTSQEIGWEEHHLNDLFCFEWHVEA